jgi:hypothetical protein
MKAHAYLFAGPSVGIFLSGERGREGGNAMMDTLSSINLSGDVGAGSSYRLRESLYLNADVRYAYGFNDIMDTEENVKWKNRDIQLMFCVLFHLTR